MAKTVPYPFKSGDYVIVDTIPEDLLRNLPGSDQDAIRNIAGEPVLLDEIESRHGVLKFTAADGVLHWAWIALDKLRPAGL